VAASIIPGSELRLQRVGLNPRRTGLLAALRLMGADIVEENHASEGGEPVADLVVRYAPLHGAEIPEELVPDMIDEFPALFIAAAAASSPTVVSGAAELRVKESDRLAAMSAGLRTLGLRVDETPDGATIFPGQFGSGTIESHGDHRIAMSFAVAGQLARGEVRINDVANVATSFPGFDAWLPVRDSGSAPGTEVHRHLHHARHGLAIAHGRLEAPGAGGVDHRAIQCAVTRAFAADDGNVLHATIGTDLQTGHHAALKARAQGLARIVRHCIAGQRARIAVLGQGGRTPGLRLGGGVCRARFRRHGA
jgi:5-enolpyruvylshikimate-3-phosphate synthase